jgi:hypothetical protein
MAVDHITGTGPWYRLDGMMAFLNHASLTTHPLVPLTITEQAQPLGGIDSTLVWTGTSAGGRYKAMASCADWSSASDSALASVGNASNDDSAWTQGFDSPCAESKRLYCFEK